MLRSRRSLAARQREMRKRQPPRRGRGRPPLRIHPDTVAVLAARGYQMLERGRAQLKFRLLSLIFEKAMEGDWRALRWQMKFRGMYGQKLPKRVRPSAVTRATYGGLRRGHGRRRILYHVGQASSP